MSPSSTSSSEHGQGSDGLVPVGGDTGGTRAVSALVVALFLLVCVGTGLVDTLHPVPAPELLGREKHLDEERRRSAKLSDGSLASLVEYDLRVTSRVRHEASPPYSKLLYERFGEAQGDAVVGRDGWLFLTPRVAPVDGPEEVLIGSAGALLRCLERTLAGIGVRLVVVPVPRKAMICARFLHPGTDPRAHLERDLLADLDRRGVELVDLLGPFSEHPPESLFFKADGHWTQRAEVIAAEELCRSAGLLVPPESRTSELREDGLEPQKRQYLSYIGLDRYVRAGPVAGEELVPSFDVYSRTGTRVEHGNPKRMPPLAICGTSFTARRRFPKYISHFAQTVVWNGAQPGANPVATVAELLAVSETRGLPDVLLLELPCHIVFQRSELLEVVPIFSTYPPRSLAPLLDLSSLVVRPAFESGTVDLERPMELLRLPPGWVASTNDGAVCLRIRGEVSGAPMSVSIRWIHGESRVVWPPGQSEVVVPLIGPEPGQSFAKITIRPTAGAGTTSFRLSGADVGIPTAVRFTTLLEVRRPRATADGWVQRVVPATGDARDETGDYLVVQLDTPGGLVHGVDVSVTTSGARTIELATAGLRPKGRIVIDLAGLHGAKLESVELRGRGAAPPAAVKWAAVLGG